MTPHGEPRPGTSKVWGLVPHVVKAELEQFRIESGLRSMNQATGAALREWYENRHIAVQNPRTMIQEGRDE